MILKVPYNPSHSRILWLFGIFQPTLSRVPHSHNLQSPTFPPENMQYFTGDYVSWNIKMQYSVVEIKTSCFIFLYFFFLWCHILVRPTKVGMIIRADRIIILQYSQHHSLFLYQGLCGYLNESFILVFRDLDIEWTYFASWNKSRSKSPILNKSLLFWIFSWCFLLFVFFHVVTLVLIYR